MPKLKAGGLSLKISLENIQETGNIRGGEKYGPDAGGEWPPDLIELADSIKRSGQLNPINVKRLPDGGGPEKYELVAGARRLAAHRYLAAQGEDFNMIDATVITGDKTVLQLIENIQREDLESREREAAVAQLVRNGMANKEIAGRLSKTKSYVSKHLAAYKIRKYAELHHYDLSKVETSALVELVRVRPKDRLEAIHALRAGIGDHFFTQAQAAAYAKKYRAAMNRVETLPLEDEDGGIAGDAGIDNDDDIDDEADIVSDAGIDGDDDTDGGEDVEAEAEDAPAAKPAGTNTDRSPPLEPPPPRMIDANIILSAIIGEQAYQQKRRDENKPGSEKWKWWHIRLDNTKYILRIVTDAIADAEAEDEEDDGEDDWR